MTTNKTRQLVTAAVLLALTLVFQNIRLLIGVNPISTYLTGTLVNLCLIVATVLVNLWAGLLISIAAPLIALLQGFAQAPMLPFIMLGNGVLVILYGLIVTPVFQKDGKLRPVSFGIAGILSTILKFAVMAAGNALVLSAKQGKAFQVMLAAGAAAQVQQLVTALIAMALGFVVLPSVHKARKE